MSEVGFDCTWRRSEFFSTAQAKKAVSAAMFILFLVYTTLVYLKHKNKTKGIGIKLNRIVDEMAYSHIFFYIGALFVHILTPKEFPVLLLYVYIATMFVEIASAVMEKQKVR